MRDEEEVVLLGGDYTSDCSAGRCGSDVPLLVLLEEADVGSLVEHADHQLGSEVG